MGGNKNSFIFSLMFVAALIAGMSACSSPTGKKGSGPEAYDWVLMDESYVPKNDVETFIKTDAENRGALPLYIRNYGSDKQVLGLFKGRQYAGPSPNTLEMLNQGLDDWMLVDIKYKTENEREVVRTVLYFSIRGVWKVGDSGALVTA
ncbi:MAG: hypothetical protein NTW38_08405 [Candidatus Aminicenantes bacterium]|nr:hypothetical protein [Candidatus Aminicenantes bacterium]